MATPKIPKVIPKKPTKRTLESAERIVKHYESALAEAKAKSYKRPLDKALQKCRVVYANEKLAEALRYLELVRIKLEGEDLPPSWLKSLPPTAPSTIARRLSEPERLALVTMVDLGYVIPGRARDTYIFPSSTVIGLANKRLAKRDKIKLPHKIGFQIVYKPTEKGLQIRKLLT